MEITCAQMDVLLSFYIEGDLSKALKIKVENHLKECAACRAKYDIIKTMIEDLKCVVSDKDEVYSPGKVSRYGSFRNNLSAYVDNELNSIDSIKIKKIAISNPLARQDLENIYTFKKLLHSSFEKTKNELKNDYSKTTICQFKHDNADEKINFSFYKLTAIFFMMITVIVAGVIKMLYF